MPYNGEFHFTALRTLGTFRTMSASRRFPRSRFQPGIPAMYACTGESPSAFAMRGLPPERTTFSPFRTLIGMASLAPGLAFAPAFAGPLLLVIGFRYDKLARSFLDALHITATTQIDLERQRRDYRVCRERSRGSDAASCPR